MSNTLPNFSVMNGIKGCIKRSSDSKTLEQGIARALLLRCVLWVYKGWQILNTNRNIIPSKFINACANKSNEYSLKYCCVCWMFVVGEWQSTDQHCLKSPRAPAVRDPLFQRGWINLGLFAMFCKVIFLFGVHQDKARCIPQFFTKITIYLPRGPDQNGYRVLLMPVQ